ncbi:hypothetical protein OH76DRAFT_912204 [Lentinus brumalis]|uniref:Uncharacterized protein n=1 Tax=Lentinus brumalis TaxID=2498619 RepID=A0A371D027_9APHY|nr:hypothetical protein OH76DRAFT_912204 [Polyporus brumalis]
MSRTPRTPSPISSTCSGLARSHIFTSATIVTVPPQRLGRAHWHSSLQLEHVKLTGDRLQRSFWRALQETLPPIPQDNVCCPNLCGNEIADAQEGGSRLLVPTLEGLIAPALRHRLERGHKLGLLALRLVVGPVRSEDGTDEEHVKYLGQLEGRVIGQLVVSGLNSPSLRPYF